MVWTCGLSTRLSQRHPKFMSQLNEDALFRAYHWVTVAVFSLGAALLVTSLIAPQLPLQLIRAVFPDEPAGVATLLRISPQVLLMLYGALMLLVAAFLVLAGRSVTMEDESVSTLSNGSLSLRFLALLSFSITFISVRAIVALSGIVGPKSSGTAGGLPVIEISVPGFEVDHFFIGFLILVIVGYRVLFQNGYSEKRMAILYGAGLGIFVDEIGLLLTEGDYFTVSTYVFATIFATAFLFGIYWDLRTKNQQQR